MNKIILPYLYLIPMTLGYLYFAMTVDIISYVIVFLTVLSPAAGIIVLIVQHEKERKSL